jgi:N-methylhydantoinase A
MADLIRRSTIMRGFDPAQSVLYAYGGAAPQYVGRYAPQVGVRGAYVPTLASVFSAMGAVASDFKASASEDVDPQPFVGPFALLSADQRDAGPAAGRSA